MLVDDDSPLCYESSFSVWICEAVKWMKQNEWIKLCDKMFANRVNQREKNELFELKTNKCWRDKKNELIEEVSAGMLSECRGFEQVPVNYETKNWRNVLIV